MLTPVRQIKTVIPAQTLPRKGKASATRSVDASEARPARSAVAAPEQGTVTLHDELPPELLNIPQMVLGKFAALASYLSNQGRSGSVAAPAAGGELDAPVVEVIGRADSRSDTGRGRRRASESLGRKDLDLSTGRLAARADLPHTDRTRAAAVTSYRENGEDPVYVPVPDSVIAKSSNTDKLKAVAQNITENAKNAYYKFMTMVPYSVGMLINVFA